MSDLEVITFTCKYWSYHSTKACNLEYKNYVKSGGENLLYVGVCCKPLTTQVFLERSKVMENPATRTPHQTCDSSALRSECKRRQCEASCQRLAKALYSSFVYAGIKSLVPR
jgi:hypothetical protein